MPTLGKYDPKPSLPLPEEVWRRIERTLGLDEPDYGMRSRISRYVELHPLDPRANLPQVQVGELRKQLKRMRDDAARLRSDIEPPKGSSDEESSDEEWAQYYAQELVHNRAERADFLLHLSRLIAGVDEALLIAISGKWPPGERYKNLIHALAAAYRIATNEEPTLSLNEGKSPEEKYSGKFFNFVVSVLDAVGDRYAKPHNNQALGQRINRALKIQRRIAGA